MSLIVISSNIISAVLFLAAFLILSFRSKQIRLHNEVFLPLALTLLFYGFVSFSNFLEHSGITDYFDPLEDVAEIVFTLVFLFFINNWNNSMRVLSVRNSEKWLRVTLESIADGVITSDRSGKVTKLNEKMEKMTGISDSEARGRPASEILHFVDRRTGNISSYDPFWNAVNGKPVTVMMENLLLRSADGNEIPVNENTTPIRGAGSEIIGAIGIFRDMSEYESLNMQLTHIHKMEAVGQLAGGVAHDIKNMLGGIVGAAEVLKFNSGELLTPEMRSMVELILSTSDRAEELTRDLLAFNRKNRVVSSPVIIQEVILSTVAIAARTIGPAITIERSLYPDPLEIIADPGQVQNALINLIINARDSISGNGRIDIRLKVIKPDSAFFRKHRLSPGMEDYISIEIEDNGAGIDPSIKERIFEPFFTTKSEGEGTGLGLSAVYGTVISHHGAVEVTSNPGAGTKFELFFPLHAIKKEALMHETDNESADGIGTILVIEDEEMLRTTTKLLLEDIGYRVITAEDGMTGIVIFSNMKDSIDVVLLDVIMPKMGGMEVFDSLIRIDQKVRVIFTSGFTRDSSIPVSASGFIKKPYRRNELTEAIKKAMSISTDH